MKQGKFVRTLALLLALISWEGVVRAQEHHPTAVQPLQLSGFAAVGGNFTGLGGGKNFDVIAGADLGLPPVHGMRPTAEVRGTYPSDHGLVDSQKSILGGLRVDFLLGHRIHPYADFLFGRGEMIYSSSFNPYNGFHYELTTTYVYSPGAGFDYDLGDRWGIKVDAQLQRWGGPTPTPSGDVYSKVGTVGIIYRFDFNRRGIR